MSPPRQWNFGTHLAVLEEPDVLNVTFTGPTTLEDAKEAVKVYAEACGPQARYLLAKIGGSALDAPARKYLADNIHPEWFCGVVYVGANLILKTISKALYVLVLFGAKSHYEIAFADSEAEARPIIDGWRKKAPAPAP